VEGKCNGFLSFCDTIGRTVGKKLRKETSLQLHKAIGRPVIL